MTDVSERLGSGLDTGGEGHRALVMDLAGAMIAAVRQNPGLHLGRFAAMPLLDKDGAVTNGAAFGWASHFGAQSLLMWKNSDGSTELVGRHRLASDEYDAIISEARFVLTAEAEKPSGTREYIDFSRDGCVAEKVREEDFSPVLGEFAVNMLYLANRIPDDAVAKAVTALT